MPDFRVTLFEEYTLNCTLVEYNHSCLTSIVEKSSVFIDTESKKMDSYLKIHRQFFEVDIGII